MSVGLLQVHFNFVYWQNICDWERRVQAQLTPHPKWWASAVMLVYEGWLLLLRLPRVGWETRQQNQHKANAPQKGGCCHYIFWRKKAGSWVTNQALAGTACYWRVQLNQVDKC